MNAAHRRAEIMNILIIRRQTTAKELAKELGVSVRTIHYDIQALSLTYPIYTRQGENGGVFIRDSYRPYTNTLTSLELQVLRELYEGAAGEQKRVLLDLLRKYGPDPAGR